MKDNKHIGLGKLSPSWAIFASVQRYTEATGGWALLTKHFRHQELLNVDIFILGQSPHCIHPIQILRQLGLQYVGSAWVLGHSFRCPKESHSTEFLSLHHIWACQSHYLTWEIMASLEKMTFQNQACLPQLFTFAFAFDCFADPQLF